MKDIKTFLQKKKKKKQQYGHEGYKNLPEKEKQKLVEYRKKIYRMKKMPSYKNLLFKKIITEKLRKFFWQIIYIYIYIFQYKECYQRQLLNNRRSIITL